MAPSIYREVLRDLVRRSSASGQDLAGQVQALKDSLESRFIEREPEILASLAGLFANEPVLLIGPVGTGKTKLIEKLGEAINGKYFYYLLHQFMEPDELLGPPNVKKYIEQGVYERSDSGSLQQANIVFFDEPFKASSPVRNMLLDIILYKRYKSGDKEVKLPMLGLFMAANEMPEDEEDAAFKDRLVVRVFVQKLSREGRQKMLSTTGDTNADEATVNKYKGIMSVDAVKAVQELVEKRAEAAKSDATLMASYQNAMADIEKAGIFFSDRTFKKIWKVASAVSVIRNKDTVTGEDLAAAIYLCVPGKEEDYGAIEDAISNNKLSPTYASAKMIAVVSTEIADLFEKAQKQREHAINSTASRPMETYVETLSNLDATVQKAKDVAKSQAGVPEMESWVKGLNVLIVTVGQYTAKELPSARKELDKRQREEEAERARRRRDEHEVDSTPSSTETEQPPQLQQPDQPDYGGYGNDWSLSRKMLRSGTEEKKSKRS